MKKAIPTGLSNMSLKTKLLISYIMLFMIPLFILGIGGYKWISDTVGGYAQKAYTNMLEKTVGETDGIFTQLDMLTAQLSNTTWVRKITFIQGSGLDESRVDAWSKNEYIENMRAVKSAIQPVEELGILFADKNTVIASYGSSDFKFMAENAFHIDGMARPEWNELLAGLSVGESFILPGMTMRKYGVPGEGVLYVRPIGIAVGGVPRSFFFAFIRRSSIEENLQALLIDEGAGVTVRDADGAPFLSYGAGAVENPLEISMVSLKTGWEYRMAIPGRLLVRNAEGVRNVILAAVGLLSLLCMGVAFEFMRNLYKPVGELVNLVRGYVGEGRGKAARNEYSWLQDGIHAMVEQENALKTELESRRPLLREVWLGRLASGSIEPRQEFEKALALLGIDMPYPVWRVCVATWRKEPEAEGIRLAECLGSWPAHTGVALHVFAVEQRSVAVLNYTGEDALQELVGRFAQACPDILLGMGGACRALEGVAASYREAAAAIDYRLLGQDSPVTWYSDICGNRNCYYYPLEMEYKISNSLRAGDAEGATALLRSLLARNLERRGVSMESVRNLLTNMELTALKTLDEAGAGSGGLPGGLGHAVRAAGDVSHMSSRVESAFTAVAGLIREKNESCPSALEQIVGFVDSSVTNTALSLSLVAERFSVSPSYISRVFTESFGKNYHLYVNEKRIAIARELLVSKQDIASVARAVGYDSDVTFRRVFKQTMGLSPSEYRERLKHAGVAPM